MEIKSSIKIEDGISVLAYPDYLQSLNGVDRIGYFVDGSLWMPFVVRKKSFLKWIELYSPVFGAKSVEEERTFLNQCVKKCREDFNLSHIISVNTYVHLIIVEYVKLFLKETFPKAAPMVQMGSVLMLAGFPNLAIYLPVSLFVSYEGGFETVDYYLAGNNH